MILKRNVKVDMPSLKRCKADELLSVTDEETVFMSSRKKRREFNDVAGVSEGLCVARRVTRSQSQPVLAAPSIVVNSVPVNLPTSKMDSETFRETEVRESVREGLELDKENPKLPVVYARRKVMKGNSDLGRSISVDREGDSDGLVDVDVGYDVSVREFSSLNHHVLSTSVVIEVESSDCSGLSDFEGGRRRGNDVLRKSSLFLEEQREAPMLGRFRVGDIVWAKLGRRYPAWPAVVINPLTDAPDAVLNCCIADGLCVMYFGYSRNKKQRVIIFIQ